MILDIAFMIAGVVAYYAYSQGLHYSQPEHLDLKKATQLKWLKWGAVTVMALTLVAVKFLDTMSPPQSN
jgi:hypothetical protein